MKGSAKRAIAGIVAILCLAGAIRFAPWLPHDHPRPAVDPHFHKLTFKDQEWFIVLIPVGNWNEMILVSAKSRLTSDPGQLTVHGHEVPGIVQSLTSLWPPEQRGAVSTAPIVLALPLVNDLRERPS
ncbi:MAG: hypothetical protein ACE5JS_11825 [Nitrospinota bacterium]